MAFDVNRGKIILKNWDAKQRELESLGERAGDLSGGIKREKYIFLRRGLARLATDPTMDERIYAGIIRAMMEKLRKDFFPNPVLRKYMEWKERLLIMPGLVKYFKAKREQNLEVMDKRLTAMGITGLSGHLRSQLDYERERIDLPISSRFEQNGALEVTLSFEQKFNEYQIVSMEATLLAKGEYDRKCSIPERYALHVNHAIYLLKGGAVRVDQGGDLKDEKWIQLDFEHTDDNGQFPLREHVLDERFSLDKVLAEGAKELEYPAINSQQVLEIIKTGAQAVFNPANVDPFYLEANPGNKGLIFRDENQRVIPLYELKENLLERSKDPHHQQLSIKKLDLTNRKDKNQGLGR